MLHMAAIPQYYSTYILPGQWERACLRLSCAPKRQRMFNVSWGTNWVSSHWHVLLSNRRNKIRYDGMTGYEAQFFGRQFNLIK